MDTSTVIMEHNTLLASLENARNKYRPANIKLLLIAEAAPDAIDRFFYYEDVKSKDFLFLAVIEALDPHAKDMYLKSGRSKDAKRVILKSLKNSGIFLIDLFELPVSLNMLSNEEAVTILKKKLINTVSKSTPIIAIKASVFKLLKKDLNGYNLIDEQVNFPSTGHQKTFQIAFKRALEKADFPKNNRL